MAAQSFALLLAVAALAAAAPAKEAKREPVAPSDIIHATVSFIGDLHSAAYEAAEGVVTKHGLHTEAKKHYSNIVGDDVIGSTCKKVGCDAKDVTAKLNQAHATFQQVKAQAYEHGAKASDHLNGLADQAVTKFETHVPAYKGAIKRSFLDVLAVTLYFAFVAYVTLRIFLFGFRTGLSIFCCFFCCGCMRRKRTEATQGKNSGKKGAAADAKATPKQAPKAKAGGKK